MLFVNKRLAYLTGNACKFTSATLLAIALLYLYDILAGDGSGSHWPACFIITLLIAFIVGWLRLARPIELSVWERIAANLIGFSLAILVTYALLFAIAVMGNSLAKREMASFFSSPQYIYIQTTEHNKYLLRFESESTESGYDRLQVKGPTGKVHKIQARDHFDHYSSVFDFVCPEHPISEKPSIRALVRLYIESLNVADPDKFDVWTVASGRVDTITADHSSTVIPEIRIIDSSAENPWIARLRAHKTSSSKSIVDTIDISSVIQRDVKSKAAIRKNEDNCFIISVGIFFSNDDFIVGVLNNGLNPVLAKCEILSEDGTILTSGDYPITDFLPVTGDCWTDGLGVVNTPSPVNAHSINISFDIGALGGKHEINAPIE